MIVAIIVALGGVSLFIFGLQLISSSSQMIISGRSKNLVQKMVKTNLGGFVTGLVVAGVTQSSAVVSVLAVEFVDKGIISICSSFAVIMGANVGTTVTAQIVSLSGFGGEAIGAVASIIGLLIGFLKNDKAKTLSKSLLGMGVLFAGLSLIKGSISMACESKIFQNLFLIDSPFILFLNGVTLTAIAQSSSAITGVMVLLANANLLTFENAVYLTLGSNVGSCFIVVLISLNKSHSARKSADFNLLFNALGSIVFFAVFYLFGISVTKLFLKGNAGRAIANFHTVFNLTCSVVFLPFTKSFEKLLNKKFKSPLKVFKIKLFH